MKERVRANAHFLQTVHGRMWVRTSHPSVATKQPANVALATYNSILDRVLDGWRACLITCLKLARAKDKITIRVYYKVRQVQVFDFYEVS